MRAHTVLTGLDAIDWGALSHSYGSAADVPARVRDALVPDRAVEAVDELHASVYHQGGHICSAAPPLLPFLVVLAADPAVTVRADLLDLIGNLAQAGADCEERFRDPGWEAAWEEAVPALLRLLADPDPAMRRECLFPLWYAGHGTSDVLWAALGRESDPATRIALLDALGVLAGRPPREASSVRRLRQAALTRRAPLERLAAAVRLCLSSPDEPDPELTSVVAEALRVAELDDVVCAAWGFADPTGLLEWAVKALGPDREGRIGLARTLLASPHPKHRTVGLRSAAEVLSRWRSSAPVLLPDVAALLTDAEAEIRHLAARVLGMCGEAARPWADALARLCGTAAPAALAPAPEPEADNDAAARAARRAREAPLLAQDTALWALARLGDTRAVAPLAERLDGERLGFATHGTHADGWWTYGLDLQEVLSPLAAHADALLPALRRRLAAAEKLDERRCLCQCLATWGPAAAPALPELLALLDTEAAPWALDALAAIGPQAAAALDRDRLRALVDAPDQQPYAARMVTRAYWRLTGDSGPALAVLLPDLEGKYVHHAPAAFLAELGSAGAPYADRLRASLPAYTESWLPMTTGYALWRVTGETEEAVPLILGALGPLSVPGRSADPAMTVAVRRLTEIGPAAVRQAEAVLERIVTADERPVRHGGWRSVPDDDALRAAAVAALNTLPWRATSRPPSA